MVFLFSKVVDAWLLNLCGNATQVTHALLSIHRYYMIITELPVSIISEKFCGGVPIVKFPV
jgi:hypothetical protein